jgi:hypothetical protein
MKFPAQIALWLIGGCLLASGCGSAEIPLADPAPVADANAPLATAPPPAPASEPRTPELADSTPPAAEVTQFTPPFPERHDMFAVKQAQGNVRRDDEKGESVELKGFINVDEPRVILSIDGVISPVPEGGEKYGVQVLSITPPSVVLKRGRDRWTAKLE